jgi:hypothetical protein
VVPPAVSQAILSSAYEKAVLPTLPSGAPTPPANYSPDGGALATLQGRLEQDRQPVTVAPKWYDRLAGGLVGFGTGYREGPLAGIKAGSAVTNRRQEATDAAQGKQVSADEGAIQDWKDQNDLAQQDFGNNLRGYEAQARQREMQDQEDAQNWDQNFRTGQAAQGQKNTDRTYEQQVTRDTNAQANDAAQLSEQKTNDQRNYRLGEERLSVERQNTGTRQNADQASQLRRQLAANTLDQQRQKAYDALENGDSKGNEGYRQQLKDIQTAPQNPITSKPYTDAERQEAIDELNAQHEAAKQQIEGNYAAQMQGLGYPVQPVRYGPDGKPLNNSNGAVPGALQPAVAPQGAPGNLPMGKGRALDVQTAQQFLTAAGGDKARARQLAARNNWKF